MVSGIVANHATVGLLHARICKQISAEGRHFEFAQCLVAWDKVYTPKLAGGLGLTYMMISVCIYSNL
jgi:hypothetical protein